MFLVRHPDGKLSLAERADESPAPGRFAAGPRHARVTAREFGPETRSFTWAPPFGDVGQEWPAVTVRHVSFDAPAFRPTTACLVALPGPDGRPLTEEGLAALSAEQFLDLGSFLPPALRSFAGERVVFADGAFHFEVPEPFVRLVPRLSHGRRACVVEVEVCEGQRPSGPLAFDAFSLETADELLREAGCLVARGSVARAAGISDVDRPTVRFEFDKGMEAWVAGGMGIPLGRLRTDAFMAVASFRKNLEWRAGGGRGAAGYARLVSETVTAIQIEHGEDDHGEDGPGPVEHLTMRLALARLRKAVKDAPRD